MAVRLTSFRATWARLSRASLRACRTSSGRMRSSAPRRRVLDPKAPKSIFAATEFRKRFRNGGQETVSCPPALVLAAGREVGLSGHGEDPDHYCCQNEHEQQPAHPSYLRSSGPGGGT